MNGYAVNVPEDNITSPPSKERYDNMAYRDPLDVLHPKKIFIKQKSDITLQHVG